MMRAAFVLAVVMLASMLMASVLLLPSHDVPQQSAQQPPLPKISPAPEFTLTSQYGAPVALSDFRGKVVAVTFIFTLCTDTCPVLTPMMSFVQDRAAK
jgi:protein SCO1/2